MRSFPLHNAVEANCKACIEMLVVDGGANLRAKDLNGVSALLRGVLIGKINALDALIRCGGDPKEQGRQGYGPVHIAAKRGDFVRCLDLCHLGSLKLSDQSPH